MRLQNLSPGFLKAMMVDTWKNHQFAMQLRDRGRPRSADASLRANNYRDEKGHYQVTELKPWHERVVDYMVAHPHAKVVDVAREFGVTPQWMGMLLKSDAFVEYYRRRMAEHQELIGTTIVARLASIAEKSLDRLHEKLSRPLEEISFGQAKDAAELSLKALGYTSNPAVNVNVNQQTNNKVVVVEASAVERARAKMLERMQGSADQIEDNRREQFMRVTASLEVGVEEVEVEDAVVLNND